MKDVIHLCIEGKVQGVGYRAWLAAEAKHAQLDGWVRNRRDGSVEAVLSGESEIVSVLIKACWQGPPAADIEKVRTQDYMDIVPAGFEILPTM